MRRLKIEQADWHVTARGARRLQLFHDEADFKVFYSFLGTACRETEMGLIADCLMSNHFHLSLSGGSAALGRCMHRLNRAYSGYHNDRYHLSGHAFEQAYYGGVIPSDFILKRVVRYIHLNPIRSHQATSPEDYPWSSFRRLTQAPVRSLSDGERRILRLHDPDPKVAQVLCRRFAEADIIRPVVPPAGLTPVWEIWQEQFRWLLEETTDRQVQLAPLEPEVVAIHLGSRMGIPPRAMGRVLSHPNGRQVSEMIRTLNRRLERTPSLRGRIESLNIL